MFSWKRLTDWYLITGWCWFIVDNITELGLLSINSKFSRIRKRMQIPQHGLKKIDSIKFGCCNFIRSFHSFRMLYLSQNHFIMCIFWMLFHLFLYSFFCAVVDFISVRYMVWNEWNERMRMKKSNNWLSSIKLVISVVMVRSSEGSFAYRGFIGVLTGSKRGNPVNSPPRGRYMPVWSRTHLRSPYEKNHTDSLWWIKKAGLKARLFCTSWDKL